MPDVVVRLGVSRRKLPHYPSSNQDQRGVDKTRQTLKTPLMMLALIEPTVWMATPFVVLLTAIALAPLFFAKWWDRHYGKAAFGLGAVTLIYYFGILHAPARVLYTAGEYVSFICVVGSLFVVSGGIHINVKGEATPGVNVLFLLTGALVSNILGTTGASMLLIRPWLKMNRYRLAAHHVVFFIFIL